MARNDDGGADYSMHTSPWNTTSQPGLEVATDGQEEKQVNVEEKIVSHRGTHALPEVAEPLMRPDEAPTRWQGQTKRRGLLQHKKRIWYGLLVVAVIGIALGVGLGVGLSSSKDSSSAGETSPTSTNSDESSSSDKPNPDAFSIGGGLDQKWLSKKGAWNGSGIARNWQPFDPEDADGARFLTIYYQDHDGDIRWIQNHDGSDDQASGWIEGPPESRVVARDAKDSTPISSMQWEVNGTRFWHIFYIDEDDMVRQKSGNSNDPGWTDGAINEENLTAYRGDLVGLHTCWGGNASWPIRLWYASDNATFEEWALRNNTWEKQRSWDGYNGAAGVGCYSWGGKWMYTALVNNNNTLEVWYQDSSVLDPESWNQTDIMIHDVYPASPVVLSEDLCVIQKQDSELQIRFPTWNGPETSAGSANTFPLEGVDIVPGTHMAAARKGEGRSVMIFAQSKGNDVTAFSRDLEAYRGSWQQENILPDE